MAAFLRKNFARGALKNLLTATATSMTLDAGHTLPTDAGSFRAVIWDMEAFPNPADDPDTEIVTASYSTPNVYIITRAQEDTLGVAHAIGSEVALHYTAGVSNQDLDRANHTGTQLLATISDHNLAAHTALGLFDASSDVDHDATTNFVANEHIDHSGVSISPGTGLTGGGDLTATRTLALNINGLTADATPDGAVDYVVTYDANAATHKKVLLNNLPGAVLTYDTDLEALLTTV
jgi:hypothetical protein